MQLLPQQLFWYACADNEQKLRDYGLTDCIECGCCDLVCPSHIPLTFDFRMAKARIRELADEKARAERARRRFEARNERLDQRAAQRREAELARQKEQAKRAGPDAIAEIMKRKKERGLVVEFERREAPYLAPTAQVSMMMLQVLVALVPAALAHVWYFGPGFIFNFIIAATACIGGEAFMMYIRGRPPESALSDYSALVTAALLAFALPSLTPWWVTATGALFGIVVAKHLYGGLGFNIFNPGDGRLRGDTRRIPDAPEPVGSAAHGRYRL